MENSLLAFHGVQIRKIRSILFIKLHICLKSGECIPDNGKSERENKKSNSELVLFINKLQEDNAFLLYFPVEAVLLPTKQ